MALGRCLGALGLAWAFAPTAAGREKYRKLVEPVEVPLASVAEAWRPVAFRARAVAPQTRQEVVLEGALLRVPSPRPERAVQAFCLHCPHELCFVNYQETPPSLPPGEGKSDHPVFVCPCHVSVFDPAAEGARIAGPAPRGLYRFRLKVRQDQVVIREVEEAAFG